MTNRPDLVFAALDQHGRQHTVHGVIDDNAPTNRAQEGGASPYRYAIMNRLMEKPLRFVRARVYETEDGAIVLTSHFFE